MMEEFIELSEELDNQSEICKLKYISELLKKRKEPK